MRKMDSIVKIITFGLAVSSVEASLPDDGSRIPLRVSMMSSSEALNLGYSALAQIEQLGERELLLKQQQEVLISECKVLKQNKADKEGELKKLNPNSKRGRNDGEKIKTEISGLDESIKAKTLELKEAINACVAVSTQIKELKQLDEGNGWDGAELNISLDNLRSQEPTPSPSHSGYALKKDKEEMAGHEEAVSKMTDDDKVSGKVVPTTQKMVEVPLSDVESDKSPSVVVKTVEKIGADDKSKTDIKLAAIEAEAQNPDRKTSTVGWLETGCNAVVNTTSSLLRRITAAPLFPVGSYPTLTLSDIYEKFRLEWAEGLSEEDMKAKKRDFMYYEFPPFFINSTISKGKYFLPHGFYYGTVKIELADIDLKLQLAKLNLSETEQDLKKLEWYKALLKTTEDASKLSGYVVSFTDKTRTCGPFEYLQRVIRCVGDTRTESMYVNFQNSRRPSGYESTKTLMEMDFLTWDKEQKTIIFWGLCGLREENELKGERDYLQRQKKARDRRQIDWPMLGYGS